MKHLISFFCVVVCAVSALGGGMDKDEALVNEGAKKVDKGFVFINGRYVDAPYKVTLEKGWLAINGIRVKRLSVWPFVEESPEKPIVPEDVFRNSKTLYDKECWEWSAKMYRWIMRNVKGTEARHRAFKEYYEKFPFVKEVRFTSAGGMDVLYKNGKVEAWGTGEGVPPIEKKEDRLKLLKYARKRTGKNLEDDGLCFFFNSVDGGRLEISHTKTDAAKNLRLMVDVLTSKRTEKEKLNILFRMMLIPEKDAENALALIRNFKPSKQLNERIAALERGTGVTPNTLNTILKDLPSVFLEKQERQEKARRALEAAKRRRRKNAEPETKDDDDDDSLGAIFDEDGNIVELDEDEDGNIIVRIVQTAEEFRKECEEKEKAERESGNKK